MSGAVRGTLHSGGGQSCLLLQHGPVERVVVLVVQRAEEDPEQLPQVHVVGSLLETKPPAVVQVHGEFGREPLAKNLDRSGHLLLADLLILLFFSRGFEPLPRQRAAIEVHEDISERLHVVSARLFDAQVGVDAGVTRRSG